MSRRRWKLIGVVAALDAALLAWTVHLQLTWHAVPHGPSTMSVTQLLRWVLAVVLALFVVPAVLDARDTAKNGPRQRDGARPDPQPGGAHPR